MFVDVYNNCRICKNPILVDIIDLGEQIITSRFPLYGDLSTPSTPICLCLCENCGLVQLKQITHSSELYEYEYGYRSGISNTMRDHLLNYQQEIISKVQLSSGDTIIDIGSNDSTMLQYYSKEFKRIGIDPTGKQFKHFYGDVDLIPNYFTATNYKNVYGDKKVKIVSSISMFYDLPDPVQFANDICEILDDDGIWTCEQSYLLTMLERNSIDTICHEHIEYYSLTPIKLIADMSGFKIIDIKFNDCNGGSFRIYFAKRNSEKYNECSELIDSILKRESDYNVKHRDCYKTFINNCEQEIFKLTEFINIVNRNGKKVYIYGASTKGNCLLQYANIGEDKIKYAVERNPNKIGKMTSTGIEIISEETMRIDPPDYLLVLPWHFRDEIIKREDVFLNNGGQLLFPFPNFEIYSSKPKVVITGCDGMIAKYVIDEFKDHALYGFSKTNHGDTNQLTKICFDLNTNSLESNLSIIKPDIIIHLAGISSSQYAFNNPIETLNTNGLVTARICDIIHRHKWQTKLFNASSSEIYKGHINYIAGEDDHNMYHLHPYSIAKIMGHSIVDFYRETYNLPFSNGVLFTIESHLKRPEFLLNKVARHAKQWNSSDIKEPLVVGSLESYRTILHASDAAKAIKTIIECNKGDTYLICNDISENTKVIDLVIKIYKQIGINLYQKHNHLVERIDGTEVPVVIIDSCNRGFDNIATNIRGDCNKLTQMGWMPQFRVNDIINELLSNE